MGYGPWRGPGASSAWGNPGAVRWKAHGLARGRAGGSVSRPSRQSAGGTLRTVCGPCASAVALETPSRGGGYQSPPPHTLGAEALGARPCASRPAGGAPLAADRGAALGERPGHRALE
jgi:hypothetical protein